MIVGPAFSGQALGAFEPAGKSVAVHYGEVLSVGACISRVLDRPALPRVGSVTLALISVEI